MPQWTTQPALPVAPTATPQTAPRAPQARAGTNVNPLLDALGGGGAGFITNPLMPYQYNQPQSQLLQQLADPMLNSTGDSANPGYRMPPGSPGYPRGLPY